MWVHSRMRNNLVYSAVATVMVCLSINFSLHAQDSTGLDGRQYQADSLSRVTQQQEAKEKRANAESVSDLKDQRNATRENAKEARRVEKDASDAARQSKNAYRQERRAQKARIQADKQAKKAERARRKSDKN